MRLLFLECSRSSKSVSDRSASSSSQLLANDVHTCELTAESLCPVARRPTARRRHTLRTIPVPSQSGRRVLSICSTFLRTPHQCLWSTLTQCPIHQIRNRPATRQQPTRPRHPTANRHRKREARVTLYCERQKPLRRSSFEQPFWQCGPPDVRSAEWVHVPRGSRRQRPRGSVCSSFSCNRASRCTGCVCSPTNANSLNAAAAALAQATRATRRPKRRRWRRRRGRVRAARLCLCSSRPKRLQTSARSSRCSRAATAVYHLLAEPLRAPRAFHPAFAASSRALVTDPRRCATITFLLRCFSHLLRRDSCHSSWHESLWLILRFQRV